MFQDMEWYLSSVILSVEPKFLLSLGQNQTSLQYCAGVHRKARGSPGPNDISTVTARAIAVKKHRPFCPWHFLTQYP